MNMSNGGVHILVIPRETNVSLSGVNRPWQGQYSVEFEGVSYLYFPVAFWCGKLAAVVLPMSPVKNSILKLFTSCHSWRISPKLRRWLHLQLSAAILLLECLHLVLLEKRRRNDEGTFIVWPQHGGTRVIRSHLSCTLLSRFRQFLNDLAILQQVI